MSVEKNKLKIVKIDADLPTPTYQTSGAAGIDLYSTESITVYDQALIRSGIAVEIPEGYVGMIKSRSGMAAKRQLHVGAGVLDSDFRSEVSILLINSNPDEPRHIKRGERIAQLLILPCPQVDVTEVDLLTDTVRGSGSFGSTGYK